MAMTCILGCKGKLVVIDTCPDEDGAVIRRVRRCQECGRIYHTEERRVTAGDNAKTRLRP